VGQKTHRTPPPESALTDCCKNAWLVDLRWEQVDLENAILHAATTSRQLAAAWMCFIAGRRLRHAEHIGVHEQRGRVGQSANVDKLYVLRACSSVKGPARLLRRARDRAERAEHAAVAFFGAQPRAALRAVIK
jgi:hypothetical protein